MQQSGFWMGRLNYYHDGQDSCRPPEHLPMHLSFSKGQVWPTYLYGWAERVTKKRLAELWCIVLWKQEKNGIVY